MSVLVFLSFFVSATIACSITDIIDSGRPCGPLFITVSASPKTYIELNWHFTCKDPPDKVFLIISNSTSSYVEREQIHVKETANGHHLTKEIFPKQFFFPGRWNEDELFPTPGKQCTPYFIESRNSNGTVVDRNCLSINPSWMEKYGRLRISDMFIPGSHNSGTFTGPPRFIKNYILNQNQNIWQQLVFGLRYFDIRVGVFKDGIYITHSFAKCALLERELDSVVNFIRKSPKEVVVIDFHRFTSPKDFTIQHHSMVIQMIFNKLGPYMESRINFYRSPSPKLQDLWRSGKRIIVAYNKPQVLHDKPLLWFGVNRDWGNVATPTQLLTYMSARTERKPQGNPLTVLMAELTPTAFYVIIHPTRSLRTMADMINPMLSCWLRNNNRSDNVNIIATDFFLGNDMVNLALETNDRWLDKI